MHEATPRRTAGRSTDAHRPRKRVRAGRHRREHPPGLPGPDNAITDVPGIKVGQVQSARAPYLTGTTVIYTPTMSVVGVDQRGGAPATKETDLLDPLNSNPGVNAVMLGGSSMYGLAATDGVIRWLEERGEGVRVGSGVAPIVPAADIFDLGRGGDFKARTTPEWGYLAAQAAKEGPVRQGRRRRRHRCPRGRAEGRCRHRQHDPQRRHRGRRHRGGELGRFAGRPA
ncbi:P1 family peptidase [Nonomuraea ferruginea]